MRVRAIVLAVLVLALFPVTASADYAHIVAPGETLTSVAAADGLSIEAIANANDMSPTAQLIAGQTLWIPPRTTANAALGAAATTDDTAEPVATTSSQVSTTTTETSTEASEPSASAGSVAPGGPIPTQERVSSTDIADIADAYGVPANLAEAVAWQESGWNNDEVSSIGAVGVMQIIPNTWEWIDRYLTPSDPLGTASAAENLRAGVLLLHQLLVLTGGNETLTVAGYYQGLASVERFGMYADTRQYVADVLALAQRF